MSETLGCALQAAQGKRIDSDIPQAEEWTIKVACNLCGMEWMGYKLPHKHIQEPAVETERCLMPRAVQPRGAGAPRPYGATDASPAREIGIFVARGFDKPAQVYETTESPSCGTIAQGEIVAEQIRCGKWDRRLVNEVEPPYQTIDSDRDRVTLAVLEQARWKRDIGIGWMITSQRG